MDLTAQLKTAIISSSLPPPSSQFLTNLISRTPTPPPLASLIATAKARLLASDLTSSTVFDTSSPHLTLPGAGSAAAVQVTELKLAADVFVQILDIENLSISRWEQVEELEAIERGEKTRGREIIRVTDEDDENNVEDGRRADDLAGSGTATASGNNPRTSANASGGGSSKRATHRLILQDGKGQKIFAMELARIEKLGVGKTQIGEKMLLKAGAVVARGTVLLTPESVVMLGGRVEAWHKMWVDGRLARLKEDVTQQGSDVT